MTTKLPFKKYLLAGALAIGAAGSLVVGVVTTTTPARAQLTVFDPGNYSPEGVVTEATAQPSVKLDPETLAIRARPPRAIRFKRGVIIAIAAIGSVSLIAVTWMALKPRLFQRGDTQQELSQPNVRPTSDGLSGAPATYSDVPRLGPPLPGDLGKPILERQQQLATAVNPNDQQLEQAEAAERERRLAELKAARESGVLVQSRQAQPTGDPPTLADDRLVIDSASIYRSKFG